MNIEGILAERIHLPPLNVSSWKQRNNDEYASLSYSNVLHYCNQNCTIIVIVKLIQLINISMKSTFCFPKLVFSAWLLAQRDVLRATRMVFRKDSWYQSPIHPFGCIGLRWYWLIADLGFDTVWRFLVVKCLLTLDFYNRWNIKPSINYRSAALCCYTCRSETPHHLHRLSSSSNATKSSKLLLKYPSTCTCAHMRIISINEASNVIMLVDIRL